MNQSGAGPRDRQELAHDPAKTTRFPRTARRVERIEAVLRHRQPDLTVVLENVHDPHNVAAVLRTCDAVGVMHLHTVYTIEEPPQAAYARRSSGSARKWVEVSHHQSPRGCVEALRREGKLVLAAALTSDAHTMHALDLTAPVALLFGNEHRGVSEELLALADGSFAIPMMGMVESLNISVACAVSLYEALRQRLGAGLYESSRLTEAELASVRDAWLKR